MQVHEKTNKQICGEVLDGILDNMFVQEESTTEIKHDDANKVVELEDHPTTKRKFDGEQYTQDDRPTLKRKYGEDQSTQDKTPIKRKCEYLDVNIHKNMSDKRNGNFIIHEKVRTCCKRMTNKIS